MPDQEGKRQNGQQQDDQKTRDELLAEIRNLRSRIGELENTAVSARTIRENSLVNEATYRNILENLRDVIFTYNLSGIVTFITQNVSRYGYTVEDIVGKSVLEFIAPSEHSWIAEVIKSRIAVGDERPLEVKVVTKQGDILIMEDCVKAVWDDDGKIIHIVCILHDVTEIRENQRALEKYRAELESMVEARTMELSEAYLNLKEEIRGREVAQKAREESEKLLSEEHQRLSSILDGSPVSTFVIDRDHRVTAWNMVNEFFTGISKKDALGKSLDLSMLFKHRLMPSLADLVLDYSDEEIMERYGQKGVRKSEIHPQAFETMGSIWIRGKEHIMAIQATRLRNAAGNVVGAIQCAQDITGRRRAEEALQNELNKFRVLYELSLNMSAEKRIEDNLLFIVEKSRQLLKGDTAYVALADAENEFVYMHTLSGIRTEAFKKMKLPYGKGLGGLVMKTRRGYIITDYFEHAGINHVVDKIVSEEGVVSGMGVPIQAGEKSFEVLYVFNRQKTEFSKSDLETLYLLGNLAGVEIARQRMERDLRESEVKYRTVFENSGSAMVIV
ncbi:MAG: hypothetical protein CSYNP_02132 [Syntrophus sp. SKADARSKE-3]|nr:hypothetical protein [Syntrophus sp. SKADARSKE-3]